MALNLRVGIRHSGGARASPESWRAITTTAGFRRLPLEAAGTPAPRPPRRPVCGFECVYIGCFGLSRREASLF